MAVRKYWTLAQILAKTDRDLDLESEVFITRTEKIDYVNEAIDEAEAEINGLYENYFRASATISLVSGQDNYTLPADIYAQKIKRIIYSENATVYTVHRLKEWHAYESHEIAKTFATSDLYQYHMENNTIGQPEIILSPPARATGPNLKIWYVRNANRLELDTDICDIPEFITFILRFTAMRCYEKESHPSMGAAREDVERIRGLLQGTLATAQPDTDNEIELDTSHYEEMN